MQHWRASILKRFCLSMAFYYCWHLIKCLVASSQSYNLSDVAAVITVDGLTEWFIVVIIIIYFSASDGYKLIRQWLSNPPRPLPVAISGSDVFCASRGKEITDNTLMGGGNCLHCHTWTISAVLTKNKPPPFPWEKRGFLLQSSGRNVKFKNVSLFFLFIFLHFTGGIN